MRGLVLSCSLYTLKGTTRNVAYQIRCRKVICNSHGPEGGDKTQQDILVEILRLQKEQFEVQTEVNEYVKKRSQFLKDVAEGANEEYDRISDDLKRGMDEIGSKVIKSVEEDVEELEKEMAQYRAEIEEDEREFDEFQKKLVRDRNEGLFFKSLFQPLKKFKDRSPQEQDSIKKEAAKVLETTNKEADSSSRTTIYAALAILLTLTITEALITGEDTYKIGIYTVLLLCLLLQVGYEKVFKNQNKTDKP